MKTQKFVIAGAGIGGLTTAIALAQAGHEVEVLEQAPALGATVGAGVTLAPNATAVYARLGLLDALLETGVEPTRQCVQHWQDGRILVSHERGEETRKRYGVPYLYMHRADLHAALIKALEDTGAKIHLSAEATTALRVGSGAAVDLVGGQRVEGDVVIAADGVKSSIRRLFEAEPPHFTGHIVWRAVVPVTPGPLQQMASYPGIHIGPGQMVVRYPISAGAMLNLVFFARQTGWAEEGWAIPGTRSELDALFGDWAPDVGALIGAIDERKLFKWAIFARKPLKTWVKDGRIALLGDAAHAMTPFLGQGAGCAIEDAMILARCFSLSDDPAVALARYEAARIERCAFIQEESNANADRVQGDEAHLYGINDMRNEETLGLFNYDAGSVAI